MKYTLWTVIAAVLVAFVAGAGQKTPMTDEQLNDEHVKGLASQGTTKVQEKKKSEDGFPSCVDYDGELQSGTKQVVAGFSYDFVIKITPKKSTDGECAAANVDLNSVATENCAVNVWEKPGGQEVVITVGDCESV